MARPTFLRTLSALACSGVVAGLCAGCSSGGRSPAATVSQFLAAWDRGDSASLTALVDRPPAGLAATMASITSGLHATSVSRVAGPVTTHGSTATAPVVSTYLLPGFGSWKESSVIGLARRSGKWEVEWAPSLVATGLKPGESLALAYQWAPRAPILGAGGTALTAQQTEVVVGIEGSRVKDAAALTKVLVAAGATAPEVAAALAAAVAHPTFFEPVLDLSLARYNQLGGDTGALYQAPGTVFERSSTRAAVTPGLAAHLVGTVGPITADELGRLGAPYGQASTVGQGGLEAYYEKQLAGTAGGSVQIQAGTGRVVSTLSTIAPSPGRPVMTSIDPAVQQAAESALSSVTGSSVTGTAAFVAVRVSTGQVLAALSDPAATPFDSALEGEFPPGSTFKVLTSVALLEAGLSPSSAASCPPTATVGGEVFHNAEGDKALSTLAQAFAESCNTAFVQLASGHLSPSSFTSVAALFGLGRPVQMGYPAVSGKVPAPPDAAALAATSIGQASVLLSPLAMASVAADVARASVIPPRLVAGAPDDSAPPAALPATVVSELRTMMASVVTTGTAAGTGLPAGTYAKTGTAQYGQGNPLTTDAWLMGWHGDVAFAMVEHDSKGNGGPVDGPIVARFLAALPAAGA
jgi:cell division protein FtsI/penicillin-binding protein 2